ncbi:MAG: leucine-rich repeat domain-containing protein [Vicingaceae bacterium]
MKVQLLLFLLFPVVVLAQQPGDFDYVFESLKEADENPIQVYHLDLHKQKLEAFPKNLSRFENLRILDLSKNKISLLPAEIGELTSLVELNLSKNDIYTIPPQIENLQQLEILVLSKNDVKEIPPEIGELTQLKNLDLWENNVQKVDSNIQQLTQLQVLDLRGMIISDEMQKQISTWLSEAGTTIQFSASCNCF